MAMSDEKFIALANILSLTIPLLVKTYEEIRANHPANDLRPIAEILASADNDWDVVGALAQEELKKLAAKMALASKTPEAPEQES